MLDPSDNFALPNAYADSIRNHAKTLAWQAVSDHGTAADALIDLLNDVDANMAAEVDGTVDKEVSPI